MQRTDGIVFVVTSTKHRIVWSQTVSQLSLFRVWLCCFDFASLDDWSASMVRTSDIVRIQDISLCLIFFSFLGTSQLEQLLRKGVASCYCRSHFEDDLKHHFWTSIEKPSRRKACGETSHTPLVLGEVCSTKHRTPCRLASQLESTTLTIMLTTRQRSFCTSGDFRSKSIDFFICQHSKSHL